MLNGGPFGRAVARRSLTSFWAATTSPMPFNGSRNSLFAMEVSVSNSASTPSSFARNDATSAVCTLPDTVRCSVLAARSALIWAILWDWLGGRRSPLTWSGESSPAVASRSLCAISAEVNSSDRHAPASLSICAISAEANSVPPVGGVCATPPKTALWTGLTPLFAFFAALHPPTFWATSRMYCKSYAVCRPSFPYSTLAIVL